MLSQDGIFFFNGGRISLQHGEGDQKIIILCVVSPKSREPAVREAGCICAPLLYIDLKMGGLSSLRSTLSGGPYGIIGFIILKCHTGGFGSIS